MSVYITHSVHWIGQWKKKKHSKHADILKHYGVQAQLNPETVPQWA